MKGLHTPRCTRQSFPYIVKAASQLSVVTCPQSYSAVLSTDKPSGQLNPFLLFCSGLRWTLSQLVMQKADLGLSNPIDMVYHIQPWMTVALLPLAIFMEGGWAAIYAHDEAVFNIDCSSKIRCR